MILVEKDAYLVALYRDHGFRASERVVAGANGALR